MFDALIIGGGPAGMTAAIYLARSGRTVGIVEREMFGGTMIDSNEIENYPGFSNVSGMDLSMSMEQQMVKYNITQIYGEVEEIIDRTSVIIDGKEIKTKSVVIASGMKYRKLDIEGEEEFSGTGVSNCVSCDMGFYAGKDVAIIGGGDTAVESVIYASRTANHVYLIHRRDELRAENYLQQQLFELKNVTFLRSVTVRKILKKDRLELLLKTEFGSRKLDVNGVFINVGVVPNTDFLPKVILNDEGFIETNSKMRTAIDGIFAIGDVREGTEKQIVSAAADGVTVSTTINEFLDS